MTQLVHKVMCTVEEQVSRLEHSPHSTQWISRNKFCLYLSNVLLILEIADMPPLLAQFLLFLIKQLKGTSNGH